MLLCEKCNEEYTQSLKFCPSCGSELVKKPEDTPTEVASVLFATVEAKNGPTKHKNLGEESVIEKKCKSCGTTVIDDEKFCINCGSPINANVISKDNEELKTPGQYHLTNTEQLQNELMVAFHSNNLLDFFWKYAIVFTLYYPIYLLMARIEWFSGLVEALDYISIFAFYAYYVGLAALWSKKNYLPIFIAFAIRFLNSFMLLFQSEVPILSFCRIAVIVIAFVFVFKDFRITGQYQKLKNCFDTKVCRACGASVKANNKFCPKCGRKVEG